MADKYALYKKLTAKAEKISEELKAVNTELNSVKDQIIDEIKDLSKPLKCEYGTFSTVKMKKYKFSDNYYAIEKQFNQEVKKGKDILKLQQKNEIEDGKAEVSEILYLRVKDDKKN
jgi:hypothetical protein